jgi:hypothetical protein
LPMPVIRDHSLPKLAVEIVKGRSKPKASSCCRCAGCRAHLGMAQSLPSAGQGLREPYRQCAGIPATCLDPSYAEKALQSFINLPGRL